MRTYLVRAFAVLAVCVFWHGAAAESAQSPRDLHCDGLASGPSSTVVRVLDGETVVLDDGRALRLVSALPPRAIDVEAESNTWAPERDAAQALHDLVLGKTIELAFARDRADRHGRIIAHAFAVDNSVRVWVQGALVERGHARVYALPGSSTCLNELLTLEMQARAERRGLWGDAAYQVRRPLARELNTYKGTFQVVEGKVRRASVVRGIIYLDFGQYRRRGMVAFLRVADKSLLGAFASDPQRLTGRIVRVRGWIEGWRVPAINLSAFGVLEIIDPTGSATSKQAN